MTVPEFLNEDTNGLFHYGKGKEHCLTIWCHLRTGRLK